jgi:hypothetical protein
MKLHLHTKLNVSNAEIGMSKYRSTGNSEPQFVNSFDLMEYITMCLDITNKVVQW